MVIACVTLLALAMHAVPMPASAQDIQDIDKRILQFMDTGNYGAALIEAQKFEAAVKAQRGTAHPDYVLALLHLGNVLGLNGQYLEAWVHFRRALAILEKSMGVTHQEVIRPLLGLTKVYAAKGQYEEANRLYKRVLAIQARTGATAVAEPLPPPEFIGTYKGLVIEHVLPRPEVTRECPAFANACARRAQPDPTMFCVIVIPAIDGFVTPQVQERLRLHEIGHCAGWPADHPGANRGDSPQPKQQPHQPPAKFVLSSMPASPPRQSSTLTMPSAVVLHEESPSGKHMIGTVEWQAEMMVPSPGHPAEMTIRADIEVPERKLAMTWLLRRNANQALPITHTIELMFSVPADSSFGGIARVPGMLMRQVGRTRGEPLSGSSIKVTPTSFLIGLSGLESDAQRNLELLSERPWLDIPVFYGNGHRAIITMEKGTSGERAFAEAFKAWSAPSSAPQGSGRGKADRAE